MSKNNRFVFLITAYNEEDGIRNTLRSIDNQTYDEWRVIIRNDMSEDFTSHNAKSFAEWRGIKSRVKIIDNEFKHGEVLNTLSSLDQIEDDEIVCRVDAGDWLNDSDALYFINESYNKYDNIDVIWTAQRWGYTKRNISNNLPLDVNVYEYDWVTSHMKTFRRSAFTGIPSSNFKDENGDWIDIACDQAIFLPLLHKTQLRKRIYGFLPIVCYHYDIDINDRELFDSERTQRQTEMRKFIRNRGYCED